MSEIAQAGGAPLRTSRGVASLWQASWMRPATLLVILSAIFGTAMILLNPPLRGPDEPAHFVRAYAYANGVILPTVEVNGRKGVYLPADLQEDYAFFNARRAKIWEPGFTFWQAVDEYQEHRASRPEGADRPPVFELFEGSEAYAPVAYAPHIAAGLVSRALGLDFLATLYLMRFFGLAAFTALAAYAVVMTPHLKWAFVLIALLPAALFGRSVVGADGAVNSLSLLVAALALRGAAGLLPDRPWERSLWMTLCVLSKPPQIVFVLLEPMIARFRALPRRWRTVALVVLPGLILSPLWIWIVDAEVAAWRIHQAKNLPAEFFDLRWKLGFMIENPLHFPTVMAATFINEGGALWRQLIGVLGWLDSYLHAWAYPLISLAVVATAFERLAVDRAARYRVALYAGTAALAYTVLVFLILFITWTPPTEGIVWGVQGRYFVAVLPLVAVMIAALCNWQLPERILAAAAVAGALVSGAASLEALWRVNWTA